MPLLRLLPALVLGGCCCCNIDWLIPDKLADEMGEAIVREGLRQGAGLDIEDGRITIENEDGRLVVGEGLAAVDPRLPVAGHPNCPIQGGASAEDETEAVLSFIQVDCDVPFDDFVSHFDKQLRALGDNVKKNTMRSGQSAASVVLYLEGDGSRFKKLTVTIGQDEQGKTSAAVMANIDR